MAHLPEGCVARSPRSHRGSVIAPSTTCLRMTDNGALEGAGPHSSTTQELSMLVCAHTAHVWGFTYALIIMCNHPECGHDLALEKSADSDDLPALEVLPLVSLVHLHCHHTWCVLWHICRQLYYKVGHTLPGKQFFFCFFIPGQHER